MRSGTMTLDNLRAPLGTIDQSIDASNRAITGHNNEIIYSPGDRIAPCYRGHPSEPAPWFLLHHGSDSQPIRYNQSINVGQPIRYNQSTNISQSIRYNQSTNKVQSVNQCQSTNKVQSVNQYQSTNKVQSVNQ